MIGKTIRYSRNVQLLHCVLVNTGAFWSFYEPQITQASLQIIERYVPKMKASIQLLLYYLEAYVEIGKESR